MEYGQRRHELQSADASERTTRMMRSVREILAEQGQAHLLDSENFEAASEAVTMPPRPMPGAATAACAAEKTGLQRPPHLSGSVETTAPPVMQTAPASVPSDVHVTQTQDKPRSLFSRLIGR